MSVGSRGQMDEAAVADDLPVLRLDTAPTSLFWRSRRPIAAGHAELKHTALNAGSIAHQRAHCHEHSVCWLSPPLLWRVFRTRSGSLERASERRGPPAAPLPERGPRRAPRRGARRGMPERSFWTHETDDFRSPSRRSLALDAPAARPTAGASPSPSARGGRRAAPTAVSGDGRTPVKRSPSSR